MKAPQIQGPWQHQQPLAAIRFHCGFCNHLISSDRGWTTSGKEPLGFIRICSNCDRPTFLVKGSDFQSPGPLPGKAVSHLPADVGELYEEARRAMSALAFTAAVLVMRKLLMHVAVDCGAAAGLSFVKYVDFLADNHIVTARSRGWIDRIRTGGNEANHEIVLMQRPGAEELLAFTEMLLKLVYEYPALAPGAPATGSTTP